MTGDPAGGRVLVVVPTADDDVGAADPRGGSDETDEPDAEESANGGGGPGNGTKDRRGPFRRGETTPSRADGASGNGDSRSEADGDDERPDEAGESAERSDREGSEPPGADTTGPTDPAATGSDSDGGPLDFETVLATLEEELDAEVVVRDGGTATEYVAELGPILDCVVLLGDDRRLIHELIEDGSVPTIVCEPPIIGRIDDAIAGEDPLGELIERVRVELEDDRRRNELRESNARLTALSHYAEDITACETVDAVVERTVEATTDALAFDYCVVLLLQEEVLVPRASTLPEEEVNSFDATEGIAGRTLSRGESEIINDIQSDPDARPESEDFRAGVSVPIDGQGVIQVASTDRDAFDEQDKEFLEILAGYTREALERIEREVTLRSERDRLHAFFGELPVPAIHVERLNGVTTVREVNRAYAERFGEIQPGKPLEEVVSAETERQQYESALDTETVSAETVERTGQDGAQKFALSVVPVSAPGTSQCAYGIYIDRTTELPELLE